MNEFLATRFAENVRRLALGIEPLDSERGTRVAHPLRVIFDEEARGLPRPRVDRHDSCLHALVYEAGVSGRVCLRFLEANRRYVPRLISYPIPAAPQAELGSYRLRVRRPRMFPGAAYDTPGVMTGVRGRVERGGEVVRWARVVATLPTGTTVVGRAHGDDRGEFLLLISALASPVGDLSDPLLVRVTVSGPAVVPVPATPELPALDPWWDLPEEAAVALDPSDPDDDPVSSGAVLPGGYTATTSRDVSLPLGTIRSETVPFTIP